MFTRRAARTSALPDELEKLRYHSLAMGSPQALATMAAGGADIERADRRAPVRKCQRFLIGGRLA